MAVRRTKEEARHAEDELPRDPVSSPAWATVKAELQRCAELRRAMMEAGWFNSL